MPLRRSSFALALPVLVACATGIDDPASTSADEAEPVVPFRAISADRPESDDDDGALEVQQSLDERPNMRAVARWDFEPASADCNGWSASGARAIRAVPSHSGTYACKLCADGSAPDMKLTHRVAGLPRGSWVVSAWLRRVGSSPLALAARVTLDESTQRAGIPISLDQEWRLLGEPLEVPNDVASSSLTVVATANPGECILVDDVVVESATARAAHSSLPAIPYVFMSR